MIIRDLAISDVDQLLAFELANREWFERFVSPRGANFYTSKAVRDHIQAYLVAKQQGRFHGCVIVDEQGDIVARANLREIDLKKSSAEVGYRVAQQFAGRGIASAATQHLIRLAYDQWHIQLLKAWVNPQNLASVRVLEKNGFVKVDYHPLQSILKSGSFDTIEYRHIP